MAELTDDAELGGCGYEYDHRVRDLGDGYWKCLECGAEGWPEDDEGDAATPTVAHGAYVPPAACVCTGPSDEDRACPLHGQPDVEKRVRPPQTRMNKEPSL